MAKATKVKFSKMWGGDLSTGDSRYAEVLLDGCAIGELEVQGNNLVSEGVLSFSGNRYSASEVVVTIYPKDFGVDGFKGELNHLGKPLDYVQHVVDMFNSRGRQLMTVAEAKREALRWIADTVSLIQAQN